jgi:hypothetical protein
MVDLVSRKWYFIWNEQATSVLNSRERGRAGKAAEKSSPRDIVVFRWAIFFCKGDAQ